MPTDKDQGDDATQDDADRDAEDTAADEGAGVVSSDPGAARNRAERRAAAKAARRGRGTTTESAESVLVGVDAGGQAVTAVPDSQGASRRPKVPPRTMSRGTGDIEGVPEWVRGAGDALVRHRGTLVAGALAVLVAVGGSLGWQTYSARKEARASDAYAEALDVLHAQVQADDAPEPENAPPRRGPRFHTIAERSRAAVEKFRRVEQRYAQSRVAPLARLSEASTLYQLGRYDEARQIYRSLVGTDVAGLEGRVLEGLAFTMEATGDIDGAMAKYRELQAEEGGTYRDAAQYYQARLLTRRGESPRAKEILHGLVDRLARVAAGDPAAAASTELRDQAVSLLRDIDPQDPAVVARDREAAEGGGRDHGHNGLQGIPPEILQQLMQRAQSNKQGSGH